MQFNCITNGGADLSRRYGENHVTQNPNLIGRLSSRGLALAVDLGIRAVAPRGSDATYRAERNAVAIPF